MAKKYAVLRLKSPKPEGGFWEAFRLGIVEPGGVLPPERELAAPMVAAIRANAMQRRIGDDTAPCDVVAPQRRMRSL